MKEVKYNFNNMMSKAKKGVKIFSRIQSKYLKNNELLLLLPSESVDEDICAIKYLPFYMEKHKYDKAVIVTSNSKIRDNKELASVQGVDRVIVVKDEELYCIGCLYRMYMPYMHMIWGCIDYFPSRNGSRIINKKNVTIDDLIRLGVYNLSEEECDADTEDDDV